MFKNVFRMVSVVVLVCVMSISVLACGAQREGGVKGKFICDDTDNTRDYRWQDEDGRYASNEWLWIDDDGDNYAECYHFKSNTIMDRARGIDGYLLNLEGKLVDDAGVVMTKYIG